MPVDSNGQWPKTVVSGVFTSSIANNGTVGTSVPCQQYGSGTVVIPAAFTGANLSFRVSPDGVTFSPLVDSLLGTVTMTVAAGNAYSLPNQLFDAFYFEPVSDQNEAAARTLTFMMRG